MLNKKTIFLVLVKDDKPKKILYLIYPFLKLLWEEKNYLNLSFLSNVI